MTKIDIARWVLSKINIETNGNPGCIYEDMVLAIDNSKTAVYKLEKLIPTLQSKKYFYKFDMLSAFYQRLIVCWFLGCNSFSNFSWGVYKDKEGIIKPLPLNTISVFNNDWFDFKYKYQTMSPEPETMILLAKDRDYVKELLQLYSAFKNLVTEELMEGLGKFYENVSLFGECLTFIRNKLHTVELVLFDIILHSREFLIFAAERDDNLFNSLTSSNNKELYKEYDTNDLFKFLTEFYGVDIVAV